jgi:hypothetical protein
MAEELLWARSDTPLFLFRLLRFDDDDDDGVALYPLESATESTPEFAASDAATEDATEWLMVSAVHMSCE